MQPKDTPTPAPPTIESTPPSGNSQPPTANRRLQLIIGGAVVLLLLIIGGIVLAVGNSGDDLTKAKNTTSTQNGKTTVSNADLSNAAIKGLVLDASLSQGYAQRSLQAADVAKVKSDVSDAGLADALTISGETQYGTTQQDGGDLVSIYWGTIGKSFNDKTFTTKYDAHQEQEAQTQAGADHVTFATADASGVQVSTTTGKKYTLPCHQLTETLGGTSYYIFGCEGQLSGTNGFISYSTVSQDKTEAQTALTKFIAGSQIQL